MARLEKRSKGTYRMIVEGGRDAAGNRIRHTKTIKARNARDAEVELAKYVTEIESGSYVTPEKMTFATYIEQQWRIKFAKELAESTRNVYDSHLRNYILPAIGHLRLSEIKTIQMENFMYGLTLPGSRKDGKGILSPRTQSYIYDMLFGIFDRAKKWRLLNINPMEGVIRPKVQRKEMNYYDAEEAPVAIEALMSEPIMWRIFMFGALIGGCRKGEIVALEWPDVNFETNQITIRKSIAITKGGKAFEKGTKNDTVRTISMPVWYMEELAEYRKKWVMDKLLVGDLWEGGDRQYLFHRGYGVPIHTTRPSQWWTEFVKRHGLKRIRLHDLRHSSATILFEAGATMKEVQKRLGHKDEKTTSGIYVHLTKRMEATSAERLEVLAPQKRKSGDR